MKPRRLILNRRFLRRHSLHLSVICTLATTIVVQGADILRGGTTAAPATGTTSGGATPPPIVPSVGGANDPLVKTTQAVQAMQALQAAARNLANQGPNHLGQNPNNPSQTLPNVPDGLGTGGLKVDDRVGTNPALWTGANAPTQTTNTTSGRIEVTVKQTAQQAILNWETFNVGKNTDLKFDQSAGGSNVGQWIAFNKVNDVTANPTQILGTISAPGQVYIINRNGIIFGGSSKVNTHTLVASSLPINDNLVERGLLNNPDQQFLFSAMALAAGANGTPAFDPGVSANTRIGDVIVQKGAQLIAPTTAEKVGGRIALVGPNVSNEGTIQTPDGQTILAAGLQVGFDAHSSSDPSLRGLDVYIGAVVDPLSVLSPYAGTATNSGLIDSPRANVSIAGKAVKQLGVISSTTSVALNGRVDLIASYDAIGNIAYNPSNLNFGPRFLNRSTGTILLGESSVLTVLPELASADKIVGSELALSSQVNLTGKHIHFEKNSLLVAPSADITVNAGVWNTVAPSSASSPAISFFMNSSGRIDLDAGAIIDASGSKNVASNVASNIVEVQLRGSELADSPLLRDGALRGATVYVDVTKAGTYDGKTWIGTAVANVAGYANLVQRTVGELTVAGGTVKLNAGEAVVVREGAKIDVSGGWVNYAGGMVKTSRLISEGRLIDIGDATPDRIYDGVYGATSTNASDKWGTSVTYQNPLALNGSRYQEGFTQGGAGGALQISAGSMVLDGKLQGSTYNGVRQREVPVHAASLSLSFTADRLLGGSNSDFSPTPPKVVFAKDLSVQSVGDYAEDASGNPLAIPASRAETVLLDSRLLGDDAFGSLTVVNPDGEFVVEKEVVVKTSAKGGVTVSASNIRIEGSVIAAGGTLSFSASNQSPGAVAELSQVAGWALPAYDATRGQFVLTETGRLSTAGLIVDDRIGSATAQQLPLVLAGGTISVKASDVDLRAGSVTDVSGGVLVGQTGKITYGAGGTLTLASGRDQVLPSVLGGGLKLGGTIQGYSGTTGGTLNLQAIGFRIDANPSTAGEFHLDPSFFNQGGFSSFHLTGVGKETADFNHPVAAMVVGSGVTVRPVVTSRVVASVAEAGPIQLIDFVKPEGLRAPVSLTLSAATVTNNATLDPMVRGDVRVETGAVVDVGALGSLTVQGDTVSIDGKLAAAGGKIQVTGGNRLLRLGEVILPESTVWIGSNATLDASGRLFLVPDNYGRRRGAVLDGGQITVSGNVVAETGSRINVSGAQGVLDLLPGESGGSFADLQSGVAGTVSRPFGIRGVATTVHSDGGNLTLSGGQMLLSDATLEGRAGGNTAVGGTLRVSSGRLYLPDEYPSPFDVSLVVKQSGSVVSGALSGGVAKEFAIDSTGLRGGGRFAADSFSQGGFSNLDLTGTVRFTGNVNIQASGRITAGTGPALFASGDVVLNASHLVLGAPFRKPQTPAEESASFFTDGNQRVYLPASYGTGTLTASAKLVDVGDLSLQGIGRASLTAANGDIRGSGTFAMAGDLTLTAGMIYPPTAVNFTIAAYDYQTSAGLQRGSITVQASGVRSLPLSGAGNLSLYASTIHQDGVLRAPFGKIQLGWDGTGTAPLDIFTGQAFNKTQDLVLGSHSVTSVSAIDPITGKAMVIPYGVSYDGSSWIDPKGHDITSGGLPQKAVTVSAQSVTTETGSQIDIRGGGDLQAYRWVSGLGGTIDILESSGSFAVIPGYQFDYAPYAPFSDSSGSVSNLQGNAGYVNSALKIGEQVTLSGGGGLPAGTYTLLPARYALLPGAFLVTPKDGTPVGQVAKPDGSSIVSGIRFNGLDSALVVGGPQTKFEVASSTVFGKRAEYTKISANAFFAGSGSLRLPGDSGQLVLAATQAMALAGNVSSSASGSYRGGLIDISSPGDILIGNSATGAPVGTLVLSPSLLSGFKAESLLIGGIRTTTLAGTEVTVTTTNLTLDNAGSPLTGPEIILAAKNHLTLAAGSVLEQSGSLKGGADKLIVGNASVTGSGNGAVVRVSSDESASLIRQSVVSGGTPLLQVGAGAVLRASSVTLDSTAGNIVDSGAVIDTESLSLGSGRISLLLNPAVTPGVDAGLVLTGSSLAALSSAQSFSLASYSSIDLLGSGSLGALGTNGRPVLDSLTLSAGEIRGIGVGSGSVVLNAGRIALNNGSNGAVSAVAPTNSGSLLLNADRVELGQGNVAIRGFEQTEIQALNGLQTVANGGLQVSGGLTIQTPILTSSKAVTYALGATGALKILGSGNGSTTSAGLGASLALTGSSVELGSRVVLPSGSIQVRATQGDVIVSGVLDVGGIARRFKDQVRYTDAGAISVSADHGSVVLSSSGQLNLAAQAGGGNAGKLSVAAPTGSVSLQGTVRASGGVEGKGGSFSLDVGSLATTAALDGLLNAASFGESRSFRVRNGNVLIDGLAQSAGYFVTAEAGSIVLTGTIDASGKTGGSVRLTASNSVTLESGSVIDVSAQDFDAAGKGGRVELETRGANSGTIGIRSGSLMDLGVDRWTAQSGSAGQYQGVLHLRAPRNAANSDVPIDAIAGTIRNASSIVVEGYRVYDLSDYGGAITSAVQSQVVSDGQAFMGAAGVASANLDAILNRLAGSDLALREQIVVAPGAELVNRAASASAGLSLNSVGSSINLSSFGGSIVFPTGTPGTAMVTPSTAGTLTLANGTVVAVSAGVPISVSAGATLTLPSGGTVTYSGTASGAMAVSLSSGSTFTTSATGAVGTVTAQGTTVTLNTASSSSIALTAGTRIALPSGTPGNNTIRASVAGQIISPTGVVTAFAANTTRTVPAGSFITLNAAGTITFASGTGGAIPVTLASGSFTTAGATSLTPSNGALTLGATNTTSTADWNLSTARFGQKSAAGFLTLRAAGDIVLFNSLSDGFLNSTYTSALNARNELLPDNLQSWSYRLVSGADLNSADTREVRDLSLLGADEGSLKLGKNGFSAVVSGGNNALTSSLLSPTSTTGLFQVIRTGSGDIDIISGRDVRLLNQFATIYSAGTLVSDLSLGGTFDLPRPSIASNNEAGALGAIQQTTPAPVQYTQAGGNVSVFAGNDIIHLTRNSLNQLIADSSRQTPTNWLYRRGSFDSTTGEFGISRFGEIASTTWWVDFTNFFEGVGALGGGHVTLEAGRDVSNVDAVAPTNARMPKGVPDASKLVELGGGDVTVLAGRNIDGGVYYVERGEGTLQAGGSITTNATRSPSRTILRTPSEVLAPSTWLPTTLFLGKGSFDVKAGGDLLLGPVANAFLAPQGYNNTFWYKTWFSTYSQDSAVKLSSLGGDVNLRLSIVNANNLVATATPALQTWYTAENVLSSTSASFSQPWLRLTESSVAPLASALSLMPGTVKITSFSNDVNLVGNLTLSPAAKGTLEILASRTVNGLGVAGSSTVNSVNYQVWSDTRINLSDANPAAIPGVASPFAYSSLFGFSASQSRVSQSGFFVSFDRLFAETGSTDGVLQTKQSLHSATPVHTGDSQPLRIYANEGDITGLTLFSSKSAQILAGQDIRDASFYLQNLTDRDISIVSAGRDIVLYDTTTVWRTTSISIGNLVASGRGASAGDVQIAGPGSLEVLAGRNLDLGVGANNADGTGTGITSIGNGRNPYLGFEGADIFAGAGIGTSTSLTDSRADFTAFITKFVKAGSGTAHLTELGLTQAAFDLLDGESQRQVALQVFYLVLRDSGRNHNKPESPGFGNYDEGNLAIATLFPEVANQTSWAGDIDTQGRDIRTRNGGSINLFAPGGSLRLATTVIGNPLTPPGIVTESGGDINVFTKFNVDLGISRIFTLKGGDEIIWSTKGNIAAGSSSKTVQSAPPTRVLIDPQSADVKTDLAGLATGGGIGVLASVSGVRPSDVDLIAPEGTIDAGDAGIRVSGNLNISAAVVVNAANISVGGSSSGTPSSSVSAPSLGGINAAASSTAAATSNVAETSRKAPEENQTVEEQPSLISVEVIGYGGGGEEEDDRETPLN